MAKKLKDATGGLVGDDPDKLPETMEEAEIYLDSNVKTDGEISAACNRPYALLEQLQ